MPIALLDEGVGAESAGSKVTWVGCSEFVDANVLRWNNSPLCGHEVAVFERRTVDYSMWLPQNFSTEHLNPKFHLLATEIYR
jgi:hypothetical protein